MGAADELLDLALVVLQERVDVVLVEEAGALRLRENEVGEEEEADPAVEGDPGAVSARR
jgi:hypothetical protein